MDYCSLHKEFNTCCSICTAGFCPQEIDYLKRIGAEAPAIANLFRRCRCQILVDAPSYAPSESAEGVAELTQHPGYQEVVALGNNVLPFIFRDMRRDPCLWLPALTAILGFDIATDPASANLRSYPAFSVTDVEDFPEQANVIRGHRWRIWWNRYLDEQLAQFYDSAWDEPAPPPEHCDQGLRAPNKETDTAVFVATLIASAFLIAFLLEEFAHHSL